MIKWTREMVEERAVKIISEGLNIPQGDIKPSHFLRDDLKADSLDIVELIMEFEDEFEIESPEGDYERLKHGQVIDLVNYLCEKLGVK